MSFDWSARQFKTLKEFEAYVFSLPRPTWCKRIVIHHTWKPTQEQWRGMASMLALERYYRDTVVWVDSQGNQHKGWSAGPHLFVATHSQDPQFDGIFQGTPINHEGVHAGICNDGIGVEVVGDFDPHPWQDDLHVLNLGIVDILLEWTGLKPSDVVGHRDCGSPKTCPGKSINLDQFKLDLLDLQPDPWADFGVCPPPDSQKGWDFNRRWLERRAELKKSTTCPIYIPGDPRGTVVRLFEGGIVVDRDGSKGKAWTWDELLKGT